MPEDDSTLPKTLWSETQFEVLHLAFEKNRSDAEIKEIVRDLVGRGFSPDYLMKKVRANHGTTGAERLKRLLQNLKR